MACKAGRQHSLECGEARQNNISDDAPSLLACLAIEDFLRVSPLANKAIFLDSPSMRTVPGFHPDYNYDHLFASEPLETSCQVSYLTE